MTSQRQRPVIGLEGMVATLTVLKIGSDDLKVVEQELVTKVAQLPNFFHDGPLVIDLAGIEGSFDDAEAVPVSPLSLRELVGLLRRLKLLPLGIRNPRSPRVPEAEALGLAVMRSSARKPVRAPAQATGQPQEQPAAELSVEGPSAEAAEAGAEFAPPRTVVIRAPIRGGQVVYAEGTDAIALAAVNSGGELIADGNVHVYGPLRGRAVAGVRGDEDARIFCQSLEAEVISIAGVYLGADDLPEAFRGKAVQISLRDDSLVVEAL